MKKLFYTGAWVTIVTALGLMGLVGFWLWYPYRTLEIKDDFFPVINKTVKQGGTLLFVSDNCKYTDLPSTTTRAFVDSVIYYIPTISTNIRKGCGKVTVSVPVSKELPPGKYHLQNIFQYQVNPIRTITITHNTESFYVIE